MKNRDRRLGLLYVSIQAGLGLFAMYLFWRGLAPMPGGGKPYWPALACSTLLSATAVAVGIRRRQMRRREAQVSPDLEATQRRRAFLQNCCPTCGAQGQLLNGPRAGMSINVLCGHCGTRYNKVVWRDKLVAVEVTTEGPRYVRPQERASFGLPPQDLH